MTTETPGRSLPAAYLVTVVETWRVEADSEADAAAVVRELRGATAADTVDIQVDAEKGQ